MRGVVFGIPVLVVGCALVASQSPSESRAGSEVREICDEPFRIQSRLELERALGTVRSDDVERVANPHVPGESVLVHLLEFKGANAQVVEAPSGSRTYAVTRLRVTEKLPGLASSRLIGSADGDLRERIGQPDFELRDDAFYFCDEGRTGKIAFSMDADEVRAISWHPYVD